MATVAELEKRLAVLETELADLKAVVAAQTRPKQITDLFGIYANNPMAKEADRLGRAYRDRVNKKSLAEFDREERRAKEAAAKKKSPKGRKAG